MYRERIEKDRENWNEIDKWIDRGIDKEVYIETDKDIHKEIYRETDRELCTEVDTQTEK